MLNLEEKKEYHKNWYQKNKVKAKESSIKRYREHKEEIYQQQKERVFRIKLEVFAYYSDGEPKCACCGDNNIEFLSIDHIKGNGNKHRAKLNIKAGYHFYEWLRKNKFPAGYRVLCFNCNLARGFFGYCPHEKENLLIC